MHGLDGRRRIHREVRQAQEQDWWEYERILERYVKPRLGQIAIHKVTRKEIAGLLDRVANENGEVMSDHVLAVLRKLCRWHEARDDAFRSPIVAGMARTRPRDLARDRILSDEEIRAIWSALDQQAYPFGPIVKMLFYTGQRRQEVAAARWDEFDNETWIIPAQRYKTKIANVVPLSARAKEVIQQVPRCGPLLFTTNGHTPFSGFSKAKGRLDDASGVSDWTLHDIRRTSRTLMVRAGVRPDIGERVLGHVIPGVAGVYDRHDYYKEKQHALEVLSDQIDSIFEGSNQPKRRHPCEQKVTECK